MQQKLMLIDGNSVLNRAFYGIRPLSTSSGLPTNAVYGFLSILFRHIDEEKPDIIAVAFDIRTKTYRHTLYEGYKATRKGMPDDLAVQLPMTKKILSAMGIPIFECEGLEADDIIGILSTNHAAENGECVIITGDKDELQLVNEKITVKLAVTKSGSSSDDIFNPARVFEKYGLTTAQLTDLKALMGDASDNIPGVMGVGEKTATGLLQKYGTLDKIYENLDEITQKTLREKLINGKENAYMSKSLGTIITSNDGFDIPLPSTKKADLSLLKEILTEYEMSKFLDRFEFPKITEEAQVAVEQFDENLHKYIFDSQPIYLIHTLPEKTVYIKGKDSAISANIDEIIPLIDKKEIVTNDGKLLLRNLLPNGKTPEIIFDTMTAAYVINPSKSAYTLKTASLEFLGKNLSDEPSFAFNLDNLKEEMTNKMRSDGSLWLYENIEHPLSLVLAEMEVEGVCIDSGFLIDFGHELDKQIEELTHAIYIFSKNEFNINSPKQLSAVLYEELMLPAKKKTKTGYSTDNDVLESLEDKHPIVPLLISYRKLTKLKSTYVEGLLKSLGSDGRIHTVFTQTVTQTGRISSIEPNLQNIPVRTPLGRQLRRAFIAKEGSLLVDADYSQIELRLLAHISGDKTMLDIFRNNEDIHTKTAAEVFNLPEEMVLPDIRRRAKAINFGIIYGIGEFTLSKDIGVSRKEARNYIDSYLEAYPKVNEYIAKTIEDAKKSGYVTTLFGRRRYIPELSVSNKQTAAFGERVARNTPIQGTAADLIKLAMIKVANRLKKEGLKSRLILQVHDELIIEAPEEEKEAAARILNEEMESAYEFSIPIIAEVHCGKTWFEAKNE